jgi:hypothetical protein
MNCPFSLKKTSQNVIQKYGWKTIAGFFTFYLVRDLTLYVVLPYLALTSGK